MLGLAKFPWLAEQARDNPFGTSRFYWIDAGLANPAVTPALPIGLRQRYGFVVFERAPLAGRYVHSVDVDDLQRIAGPGARPISMHVAGGMFGGGRDDVLRLARDYDGVLRDMLGAGLLGTEDTILTILHVRAPSGFTAQTCERLAAGVARSAVR